MEQATSTRQKTKCIRLLIYIYIAISSLYLHSQEPSSLDIKLTDGPLFVNSEFSVEIKLNKNIYASKKKSKHISMIIENPCMEFIDSNIEYFYDAIILKNTYKLIKIGRFNIDVKLKYGNEINSVKKLFVVVEPPKLSSNTEFKWKIFSDKNKEIKGATQGKKYIIVLVGLFYKTDANIDVNCSTPENTILEFCNRKINLVDYGWNEIASFYWTPLKDGEQKLPFPNLGLKNYNNTITKLFVPEQTIFVYPPVSQKNPEDVTDNIVNKNLLNAINYSSSNTDSSDEILNLNFPLCKAKAENIAKLKINEANSVFPFFVRAERMKLENELGIKRTFGVTSLLLKKISFIFALISTICLLILFKKHKQKTFSRIFIFLILVIFIFTSIFMYTISNSYYVKAIYIPQSNSANNFIYHIPELSGTVAGELKIGETVKIKKETSLWIYVETAEQIGGWKFKKDFIILGKM